MNKKEIVELVGLRNKLVREKLKHSSDIIECKERIKSMKKKLVLLEEEIKSTDWLILHKSE